MSIGSEDGPSPSTFVAKAVTVMFPEVLHEEEEMLKRPLHTTLPQEDAGMVVKPHILPEVESE